MASKPPAEPDLTDPDNPEWTQEDFARARPGREVLPPALVASVEAEQAAKRRGRPPAETPKARLSMRVDADVLEAMKAIGPGWQTAVNDKLRQVMIDAPGVLAAIVASPEKMRATENAQQAMVRTVTPASPYAVSRNVDGRFRIPNSDKAKSSPRKTKAE